MTSMAFIQILNFKKEIKCISQHLFFIFFPREHAHWPSPSRIRIRLICPEFWPTKGIDHSIFDSSTRRDLSISASFRFERIWGEGEGGTYPYAWNRRSIILLRRVSMHWNGRFCFWRKAVIYSNCGKVDDIAIRRSFHFFFFSGDFQVQRKNWNTIQMFVNTSATQNCSSFIDVCKCCYTLSRQSKETTIRMLLEQTKRRWHKRFRYR